MRGGKIDLPLNPQAAITCPRPVSHGPIRLVLILPLAGHRPGNGFNLQKLPQPPSTLLTAIA